jgi:hypothetical protein
MTLKIFQWSLPLGMQIKHEVSHRFLIINEIFGQLIVLLLEAANDVEVVVLIKVGS